VERATSERWSTLSFRNLFLNRLHYAFTIALLLSRMHQQTLGDRLIGYWNVNTIHSWNMLELVISSDNRWPLQLHMSGTVSSRPLRCQHNWHPSRAKLKFKPFVRYPIPTPNIYKLTVVSLIIISFIYIVTLMLAWTRRLRYIKFLFTRNGRLIVNKYKYIMLCTRFILHCRHTCLEQSLVVCYDVNITVILQAKP